MAADDLRPRAHCDQPLFRDGLGRRLARHRRRPLDRGRALAAWVPNTFWQSFFLAGHPILATLWGPLIGPLAAVISFVCSVGNIPLAAVLWNGGISFGGVVAFIFADLIILPILNIYRKYYRLRMAGFLFVTFYAAMAPAALIVDRIFRSLALIPSERQARVVEASIAWNYTTWLNLAFLILAGLLISFPQNRRPGDAAHDEQASGPRKHPSSCCLDTCDRGAAGSAAPEVIACRALTGARGTSAPKDHVHAGCESSAAQEGHERDPVEILSLRQLRQLAHHEFKIVRHFIAKSAFFPPGTWEPSRRTLSMPTAMP